MRKQLRMRKVIAAVVGTALCCWAIAAEVSTDSPLAAIDADQFAEFMDHEVFDAADLAEEAELQRLYFNRITPPGVNLLQPMFPSVAPFDAANFDDSFLDSLLDEDQNSVAIYPLSLVLDPETRATLIYNAEGTLITTLSSGNNEDIWPEGADPARVILQLDLLPNEDVEPYLYTESRIADTASARSIRPCKPGGTTARSLTPGASGITDIQSLTNGVMRITATNDYGPAELFSFTVWHTSTVTYVSGTNVIWWTASPPFNGLGGTWECRSTNLVFTNGIAIWDDDDIPTNARQRSYAFALLTNSDSDSLTDGSELFIYHTNPDQADTDGDAMLDDWEVQYGLDPLSDDSLDDPDEDGLPNVYEQFHGTNPTNSDAAFATILRVDPGAAPATNVFNNLKSAFNASVPYSIIEVADGTYSGSSNTFLWFPPHPIFLRSDNGGISRQTIFKHTGFQAAFYFDSGQDAHTIVRGLEVQLAGQRDIQIGFWLGTNSYWGQGGGATPFFDGVSVELGENTYNYAFYCAGSADGSLILNNCAIRGLPGKESISYGICAIDSPPLILKNCSFLSFPSSPYARGMYLESVYVTNPISVDMANCLWDTSFTASNPTPPFIRSQGSNAAPYDVHIADSIMPTEPTWFSPDVQSNLLFTNALVALGGHLRTGSPGINSGGPTLTRDDFEGQTRDASPDIGADEYASLGAGDSDGDGIPDSTEVETYGTDPYQTDSDHDQIPDNVEVADGTDPASPWSYQFEIVGVVTNLTGSSAPVLVCQCWGRDTWNTNTAIVITNGLFSFGILASNQPYALHVGAFCDFNTNNVPDSLEPVYWQTIDVTGSIVQISFLLKDYDGDYIDDWQEILCNTDPLSSNDFLFSVSGVMRDIIIDSGNFYVGLSLTTNASDIFAVTNVGGPGFITRYDSNDPTGVYVATNVSVNGFYSFTDLHITNFFRQFYLLHFDDFNTNGIWDTNEMVGFESSDKLNRSNYVHRLDFDFRDRDFDSIPDFWEARQGLNWTNQADALEDPDGDGLLNLYEYWTDSDPWTPDNTFSNTAMWDAITSVDSLIAGKSPSTALPIFTIQDHANTNYVRNTNCWAYPYDLTCNSPWNTFDGVFHSCTLISPRHVLFAAHYDWVTNGTVMRFIDNDNNVIARTVVEKKRHPQYDGDYDYPDLTVGLLDSDVPTNQISFVKVLPDDYIRYLHTGAHLPVLGMNQYHKANVFDTWYITHVEGKNSLITSMTVPNDATRYSFYKHIEGGDSGYPLFMILSGEPVLLTVWSDMFQTGTSANVFKHDLNQLMYDLGGGYQLTEIGLSGYQMLRE